jgi:hypothetical protein
MKYLILICLFLVLASDARKPQPWGLNFWAWCGSIFYGFMQSMVLLLWYSWVTLFAAFFGKPDYFIKNWVDVMNGGLAMPIAAVIPVSYS